MIKRTFVLFFCLIHALAFSAPSKQQVAVCNTRIDLSAIAFEEIETDGIPDEEEICEEEECVEMAPIVRADEPDYEWRENLSELLRHRHSSYRFTSLEMIVSVYFKFATDFKTLHQTVHSVAIFKTLLSLPDYYSFLHRLCPF